MKITRNKKWQDPLERNEIIIVGDCAKKCSKCIPNSEEKALKKKYGIRSFSDGLCDHH